MPIATINPATGETVKAFTPHTDAEVDERLGRAADAFRAHRRTTFAERARLMRAAAEILDAEHDELARTMTVEMGKTLAAARAEAQKCARACRYFADHAEQLVRPDSPPSTARGSPPSRPTSKHLAAPSKSPPPSATANLSCPLSSTAWQVHLW